MSSAKYVNLNHRLPIGEDYSSLYSKIKSAGSALNKSTIIIIVIVILFVILAGFYYVYYVSPKMISKYHANSEQVPLDMASSNNKAELMFFYTDWCPHCKTAKPIWNDLKTEYQNKTINGYNVIFTEINCTEETTEVEQLMNQFSIEGYPTIKLIKDEQVIEYDAKPNKETLTQFLNTVL